MVISAHQKLIEEVFLQDASDAIGTSATRKPID
jgi:hypothetical protein